MDASWLYRIDAFVLCMGLAVAMLLATLAGTVLARRARRRGMRDNSIRAVEGGLLGLLSLLLAFTFSGAASRYDARGAMMIDTANAIRTAIQRTELYPDDAGAAIRADLARYVDGHVALYRAEQDPSTREEIAARLTVLENDIWERVAKLSHDPSNTLATGQMSPALDRMFGLSHTRQVALAIHIPDVIVLLLFVMATATALTSGYASALSGVVHPFGHLGFALLTALVVYVTLDLDRPGRGMIRRDAQEQAFVTLTTSP
ncbi:hypothetical protein EC912_102721 [Luteibacter rhizovicinus]|uniref:DUF4239 domain-containing protein n=1 Tax=Luteibacter rhizovicinus TaxID=242606 RepID=A0A4R3YUY1_9GAMM|nr:hypothetical protein [Luteibacter rhizovicinus]TCV96370.1 hypothetical protein EC912_102721 [Luteibacter rhizovicinus]